MLSSRLQWRSNPIPSWSYDFPKLQLLPRQVKTLLHLTFWLEVTSGVNCNLQRWAASMKTQSVQLFKYANYFNVPDFDWFYLMHNDVTKLFFPSILHSHIFCSKIVIAAVVLQWHISVRVHQFRVNEWAAVGWFSWRVGLFRENGERPKDLE